MAARPQYCMPVAKVMVVDYRLNSAEDTCQMIAEEGGEAIAFQADATKSDDCQKLVDVCVQRFGRVDILHNNVGGFNFPAHRNLRVSEGVENLLR